MPYIPQQRRPGLRLGDARARNVGELNYVLTSRILQFLEDPLSGLPGYEKYNAVMGVLACIEHELYRRMVAGYEDQKIKDNGDVYEVRVGDADGIH